MARTAILCPSSISCAPKVSIKLDLPTPGTPEIPSRMERPVCGRTSVSKASASARWFGRVDSIRVMARARARRLPASRSCVREGETGAFDSGMAAAS